MKKLSTSHTLQSILHMMNSTSTSTKASLEYGLQALLVVGFVCSWPWDDWYSARFPEHL